MAERQKTEKQTRKMVVGRGGEVLMLAVKGMINNGDARPQAFRERVVDAALHVMNVAEEGISSEEWDRRLAQAESLGDNVSRRVTGRDSWGRK